VLVSRDSMIGVAFAQNPESTFTAEAQRRRGTQREPKELARKKLG